MKRQMLGLALSASRIEFPAYRYSIFLTEPDASQSLLAQAHAPCHHVTMAAFFALVRLTPAYSLPMSQPASEEQVHTQSFWRSQVAAHILQAARVMVLGQQML
ncbi:hypothetical protein [Xanthomonas campestris]|uniref:Uncharacterized protein n=1 Tax=Xanthomonas campestris pv. papavericola TaxID=487881 RepID=A0AAJ2X1C8_XANCA|nr:hypothetical protein [Xanthomonas campestris]MEC3887411.1 hypothetical protein [Xanthomonas campestris pv. papavericola]